MPSDEFEFDKMFTEEKKREIYNNIRIDQPFFARLDGWAFHTFTKNMGYDKPYDINLTTRLVDASIKVLEVFEPRFAYLFSDEISFYFSEPPMFDRLEKLDSLLPSLFSSVFSKPNSTASFDCRIILVPEIMDVFKYLMWRQSECGRNFLNGWAEKVIRQSDKISPSKTARKLSGVSGRGIKEMCLSKGVDLDILPRWQQNGMVIHTEKYFKQGYNPITKENVMAQRRQTKEDWEIPKFSTEEGKKYIISILSDD